MPFILLIRHGQTDSNAAGVLQGHLPVPLNALGRRQAVALAERLAAHEPAIDVLLSSDLRRAVETAAPVERLLGREAELDARWRERSFGPLEGTYVGETELWRAAAGTLNPPGAEPIDAMAERVHAALLDAADRFRTRSVVAVVTHGGVVRTTLALLASGRLPLFDGHDEVVVAPILNASVLHLEVREWSGEQRWRLVRLNDVAHLSALDVTKSDAG